MSGRVFHSFIEEQASQLILSAKLLSGDFAFKQAYADGDRETLFSAVTNLQQHRIGADVMVLADADEYLVIIDTLHPASYDVDFPFPELIETAEETGEPSSALGTIDGRFSRLFRGFDKLIATRLPWTDQSHQPATDRHHLNNARVLLWSNHRERRLAGTAFTLYL